MSLLTELISGYRHHAHHQAPQSSTWAVPTVLFLSHSRVRRSHFASSSRFAYMRIPTAGAVCKRLMHLYLNLQAGCLNKLFDVPWFKDFEYFFKT